MILVRFVVSFVFNSSLFIEIFWLVLEFLYNMNGVMLNLYLRVLDFYSVILKVLFKVIEENFGK